jgi:hypothetical protein
MVGFSHLRAYGRSFDSVVSCTVDETRKTVEWVPKTLTSPSIAHVSALGCSKSHCSLLFGFWFEATSSEFCK